MYKLHFNILTRKVDCVIRLSDSANISSNEENMDYQDFLKWNNAQPKPLDLNSTIEPVKPQPVRDLAKEIDDLKAKVAELEKRAVAK
jgi:hypothetical protein